MLDVARNFHPKATVLRTLDLMARYKLNVFHFHLTEDEAGASRSRASPSSRPWGRGAATPSIRAPRFPRPTAPGPETGRAFGSGFYSRADYVEILRYAAARHIEVIPELEMPGHARAAIKAMEARARALRRPGTLEGAKRYLLSDPEDRSVYTSAQRYHDNVMNPALPSTYAFIERVVQDLVAMHREAGVPLRNLHMGGDEVPAGVWERSPVARAYLKEGGLGERRRALVPLLRPGGADPEGARPRPSPAGRRSRCARSRARAGQRSSRTPPSPAGVGAPTCGTTSPEADPRIWPIGWPTAATRWSSARSATCTSTWPSTRTRRRRASTGAATSTWRSRSPSSPSTTTGTCAKTAAATPSTAPSTRGRRA